MIYVIKFLAIGLFLNLSLFLLFWFLFLLILFSDLGSLAMARVLYQAVLLLGLIQFLPFLYLLNRGYFTRPLQKLGYLTSFVPLLVWTIIHLDFWVYEEQVRVVDTKNKQEVEYQDLPLSIQKAFCLQTEEICQKGFFSLEGEKVEVDWTNMSDGIFTFMKYGYNKHIKVHGKCYLIPFSEGQWFVVDQKILYYTDNRNYCDHGFCKEVDYYKLLLD